MEITMQEVLELQPIYQIVKSKILPMKTSYKLAQLFKVIQEKFDFYQTQINLIITEYGEKDENGEFVQTENDGIKIKSDKIVECQEKVNELSGLKIEVPNITFSFEELEPLELTLEQFMFLIKFCAEEKADS